MTRENEFEEFLSRTPRPLLSEGGHRHALKARLLQSMAAGNSEAREGGVTMARWRRRLAWACMLLVLAAGLAWGAQKLVRRFVVVDEGGRPATLVSSDDPGFTQADAQREYEEMLRLKQLGQAELIETTTGLYGKKHFVYKFTYADGSEHIWSGSHPIDYVPDVEAINAEMKDQIARGEGRLVGVGRSTRHGQIGRSYTYAFTASDGFIYTSTRSGPGAAYLGGEDAVFDEVDGLMASGEGELIIAPNEFSESLGVRRWVYLLTLSDGREMTYTTDEPLKH